MKDVNVYIYLREMGSKKIQKELGQSLYQTETTTALQLNTSLDSGAKIALMQLTITRIRV
jgi:hypothetical protein